MKFDHDLHLHTYLSDCCRVKDLHTPARIIALAETMGLHTIGFADHVWANPHLAPSDWYRPQNEKQIDLLRRDLSGISTSLRVLVGCEAEMVAPGKFGVSEAFARQLDFVLLACSHFHIQGFVEQPVSDAPGDVARHLLRFFRSGVFSGLATSIAHPLLPIGYLDSFDQAIESLSDAELLDAFGLACDRGVAIEITLSFIPSPSEPKFSIETPIRFLSLARQAGCRFTLGSDAHEPDVQKRLPELARLTHAADITGDDILPLLHPTAPQN